MGPFDTWYTGCQSCSHTFCTSCTIVTPDKKDSERVDVPQGASAGASHTPSKAQLEGKHRQVQLSTILDDVLARSVSGFAASSESRFTLPNDTLPNLPSDHGDACPAERFLSSQHIIARPEQPASGTEEKPTDGSVFWLCCKCSGSPGEGGPWLLDTTPSCLTCNRARCVECTVWEE